jgi:hypothetical protein
MAHRVGGAPDGGLARGWLASAHRSALSLTSQRVQALRQSVTVMLFGDPADYRNVAFCEARRGSAVP